MSLHLSKQNLCTTSQQNLVHNVVPDTFVNDNNNQPDNPYFKVNKMLFDLFTERRLRRESMHP